jgi:hypothetical protein
MNKKLFLIAILTIGFIGSASAQTSITSCSDLNTMSNSQGNYQLQNDLDCSSTSFSEGVLNDGYQNFEGTFDGNGYTIHDLTIQSPSSGSGNRYAGIFRKLDAGTFKDVRFKNPELVINGGDAVAGIASSRSSGKISDVEVIGFEATGSGGFANIGFFGNEDSSGSDDGTIDRLTMINTTLDVDLTNGYMGGVQAQDRSSYADISEVTIKNMNVLTNDNGAIGGSPITGWTSADFNNVKIEDYTVDGFINDDLLGYGFEGTLNNVFIAEATADQFSTSSSPTYSDAYIDSESSNSPTGGLTTLTTSESTGTNAQSNMNFDFTNTWTVETNPDDYPALLYTKEPQITGTTNPNQGDVYNKNTQIDFDFSVNTGGQSATVDLIVEHPNGSEITEFSESLSSGTSKGYNIQRSFSNTGDYSWYVDIGTDQSSPINFEVIDYSQPSITLSQPNSGEVFKTYQNSEDVTFGFSVNSDLDGTYEIQNKNQSDPVSEYKTISSGSIASGSNAYLDFITLNLTSDLDQRDWRVVVDDEIDGGTSSSDQFTLENIDPPNIELTSPVDGSSYYLPEGGSVDIPVEGWINQSEITGEAYGTFSEVNVNYEENLGGINIGEDQFFNGSYTATQTGTYNDFRIEARYGADVFSSSNVDVSVIRANPTFTVFNVTPSISEAQPTDTFQVNVEGDINRDEIDRIEYELRVDGTLEDSVSKDVNFQDQNQFTDSMNQFEMKEAYQGSNVEISATVYDTEGLTDSISESADTATPPDGFIQDSPNPNQVFLIPEGDSEVPVSFEYGVDTAERGGTVELILNGNSVDSASVSADTQVTQTYNTNLSDSQNQWKVRFTDSQDGEVYESVTQSFTVTDEPIALSLISPTGGETIDLVNTTERDISHDFEVDARALSAQYYYEFQLNNTDSGTIVEERTSTNLDTGIESFSETVNSLGEGNYSWSINIKRSSDDILLESASTTYNLEENPLFSQDILSPVNGATFFLNESSQMDIDSSYEARAESSNIDLTLFLDGNQVDSRTVSAGSYSVFDKTLFDVSEGDHTLKLMGEDGDGRVQNTSVNFEVAQPKETSIEFNEISTDPPLTEAQVGEEVDLYIEGSGDVSDVQYLQVEIKIGGEVVDTKIVDTDNLKSGSWFITLSNALTVTQSMIGEDASLIGTAESVAGDVISQTKNYFGIGSNRDISAELISPNDGRVFDSPSYSDTDSDSIPFSFKVNTLDNPVDYTLMIRPNGSSSYQELPTGTPTGTVNETETIEIFRNMKTNLFIQQQYGEFDWKVKLNEQNTNRNATSGVNTFSITEPQNTTLNFVEPRDHKTFYLTGASTERDINFNWQVDSTEEGTVSLEVNDFENTYDVSDGFSQLSETISLDAGTYQANLSFSSENFQLSKSHEFSIEEEEKPDEPEFVELIRPQAGATVYQLDDGGRRFGWKVKNTVESGSGEGNSTLFIENDQGDIVREVSRDYDTQNEEQSYNEVIDTQNLNIGEYTFYAKFDADQVGSTLKSTERDFTIKDFRPPEVTLLNPLDETFTDEEKPNFEFRVESFEQSPTIELRYRQKGEYTSQVLFDSAQQEGVTRDYSYNESSFARGDYEWFIRTEPDQFQTFDSNISTFNVEPSNINAPEFTLSEPQQDERFNIPNSSDSALIEFNYSVEGYSQKDAQINLMLQKVLEDSEENFKRYNKAFQNIQDGNQSYSFTQNLSEAGYRWKIRVEYPNGQTNTSDVQSFAVNDPETEYTPDAPDPTPTTGFFNEAALDIGGIIDSYKSAVGDTGQLFTAMFFVVLGAGITQLAFKMEAVSLIAAVFLTLGFSLADGFFPVSFFWIVLAIAAGLGALSSGRILGGDS